MPSIIAKILDAALDPAEWTSVLEAITKIADGIGAAYIIRQELTGRIGWTTLTGVSIGMDAVYANHYAAIDPYLPLLRASEDKNWQTLLNSVPEETLRQSSWYNEFLLPLGVQNIIGVSLVANRHHTVVLGIHQPRQASSTPCHMAALRSLLRPLQKAAQLHIDYHHVDLGPLVCERTLDQLPTAVLIVDGGMRMMKANQTAEEILRAADALFLQRGILVTRRSFETARLHERIASAATSQLSSDAGGRMLVARPDGGPPYVVTILPFGRSTRSAQPNLAVVLIVDPDRHVTSQSDLIACFGLSTAEARLAQGLMSGKRLADMAVEFSLNIATLRTQLRAVLRKVGAERQPDLVRKLSSVGIGGRATRSH